MERKTGILGGTFNPVHRGHVELGLQISCTFSLDRVLYILSANPPHKSEQEVVSPDLRWEMLGLALEPYSQLTPCDIEMRRLGYSYTIQTIHQLREAYPDDQFYFISGSEGFLKIRTWKNYRELLDAVSFIVVLRNVAHRPLIESLLHEEGVPFFPDPHALQERIGVSVFSYDSPLLSISSTLVRQRFQTGGEVDSLIDQSVKKVIEEYRLYGA